MNILYAILAAYLIFALVRIFYQIATGFLYVTPTIKKKINRYKPLVSIIIPAWNEEVGITKTIRSTMMNSYKNIEVIVVDDGSKDQTKNRVLRLQRSLRRNGHKIRLISQTNTGKAGALNRGISEATGELIITLDADSYLTKHSIRELVKVMSDSSYDVAMGEVIIGNTKTLIGKVQHYEYLVGFHFKRSQHIFHSAYIFPGALTLFRASVLQTIGNFEDYSSTEDLDISMRIKAAGYRVAYVDTATCVTEGATSLKGLLNQRTRWRHGFIDCMLHQKDFVWSSSKGKYLSYIDFPLSIIGVIEVLFYPFVIGFLVFQLASHPQLPVFLLSYALLPFVFFLLGRLRNETKMSSITAFLIPIALSIINIIEYIALLISIYRTIRRKKTTWTVWQRTGTN
jgi:biofilm PGA synthesis N-glycosyltransferase PgaC